MTIIAILAIGLAKSTAAKGSVEFDGMYVEGCSCMPPCPCEIVGLKMGCQGVGGFSISSGSFEGEDLAGVKFAYATVPGTWVTCYVDAPTAAKRRAGEALAKAAFGAWGKMGKVKSCHIAISGSNGKYSMAVDGGKVMTLTTEPYLGLNKSKPIQYSNINSVMHPVVMQAKTLSCTYHDGDQSFQLKGTNAYFNSTLKVKGKLGGA